MPLSQGIPWLCQGPGPLAGPSSIPDRCRLGDRLQEEGCHDGCFQHRLGSSVERQADIRLLVRPGEALAHPLPGNAGVFSGSQNLPARPEGAPCLGQHVSSGLPKSPRWSQATAYVQAGETPPLIGTAQSALAEGSAHARQTEPRGRHAISGWYVSRRVEAPHPDGSDNLECLQEGINLFALEENSHCP